MDNERDLLKESDEAIAKINEVNRKQKIEKFLFFAFVVSFCLFNVIGLPLLVYYRYKNNLAAGGKYSYHVAVFIAAMLALDFIVLPIYKKYFKGRQ